MDREQKPERKETVERGNVRYLWVLVGAYLLYLAYGQVQYLLNGDTRYPIVSIVSAAVFAGTGGLVLWREWKAYQYARAHKDDPETWNLDAPESAEPPEDAESLKDTEGTEKAGTSEKGDAP